MTKAKRNVGREILDGLRELKRGEYGRVVNVPSREEDKEVGSDDRPAGVAGDIGRVITDVTYQRPQKRQ